jgi:hypothetical protein
MKPRAITETLSGAGCPVAADARRDRMVYGMAPAVIVTTPEALDMVVRNAVREALHAERQDARPLLLDRTSVARVLGVGTSTIDRFRKAKMPCVWIGDSPRFIVDECLAWVRANRRVPTEATCEGQPANDV